ncbi:acyl-CoA N-acyltransferase [Fusarium flagelliforme]|uniref:Gnat family protein n=1 Tax=Fusarium flagelliforme TaxID=2675880 RepID=A0A395N5I7_9HYPO|nr:acyl-CoA N-acyltransferase [Fusarium flagelliforme]KAH7191974.1 acyl-CoA N-acyltransferase [Fusarium flagelliforme]RFN55053.1 gnat family protein [Fusarium flagelliforme]
MPLQIRPAVPQDIPGMCKAYYSAFGDTIIGSRVFCANKEASDQFFLKSFAEDMADPNCKINVVTHKSSPESKDEQVVAMAKWNLPGAPIQDVPPAEVWPADGDLAVEFFGTMTEGHRRLMGDRPHYHLEVICVHEEWQGKGAASLLIRWGVERADAEGLPCFLEATPKGRPIYEKYGFQMKGQDVFEWSFGKSVETYMERDAKVEKRSMTRPKSKELA